MIKRIHKFCKVANALQGRMKGGFLGFQETPFDNKTISKITYLNISIRLIY